jgi:hypothetical protein
MFMDRPHFHPALQAVAGARGRIAFVIPSRLGFLLPSNILY